MEISIAQLKCMLEDAAEIGGRLALIKVVKLKPHLKKSESFRIYGRANIERWIEQGLITPRKDGYHSAVWRIDRMEVEPTVKSFRI